jgi:hypothetical protein
MEKYIGKEWLRPERERERETRARQAETGEISAIPSLLQNKDDAQRKSWQWLDKTLFDKLGGTNCVQYSDADAAIDAGQAEYCGRDRAFSRKNLDDSFNDAQYYGST